jgi:hypothetical protein
MQFIAGITIGFLVGMITFAIARNHAIEKIVQSGFMAHEGKGYKVTEIGE